MLVAGGKNLLNGGLAPFQAKARDRARQFVLDQKPGATLDPADEAFADRLAEEVFNDFKSKFRARDDVPDPVLKSLAGSLRSMMEKLNKPATGTTSFREQFERDALSLALEIYKLKTNNLEAIPFEGANRQFVLDLAHEILTSRDTAPPAPANDAAAPAAPTAADPGGTVSFTAPERADLISVLRRKDAFALRAQANNDESFTEEQRVEQLRQAVALPRNSFIRALKKVPNYQTLTSLAELSAADQKELNDKMIPEAVRANSAAPATSAVPATNGKTHTRVELIPSSPVDDGTGESYGVAPAGSSYEDGYLLTEGSRRSAGCRLFGGTRRASRGAVLLRSPNRSRSSRSVVYYVD